VLVFQKLTEEGDDALVIQANFSQDQEREEAVAVLAFQGKHHCRWSGVLELGVELRQLLFKTENGQLLWRHTQALGSFF